MDIHDMKHCSNAGNRFATASGIDRPTNLLFAYPLPTNEPVGVANHAAIEKGCMDR